MVNSDVLSFTNEISGGTVTIGIIRNIIHPYPTKHKRQTSALPPDLSRKKGATKNGKIIYAHHSVLIDQEACTQVNQLWKFMECRRSRFVIIENVLLSTCKIGFLGIPSLAAKKKMKIVDISVVKCKGYTLENRAIVNFLKSFLVTFL